MSTKNKLLFFFFFTSFFISFLNSNICISLCTISALFSSDINNFLEAFLKFFFLFALFSFLLWNFNYSDKIFSKLPSEAEKKPNVYSSETKQSSLIVIIIFTLWKFSCQFELVIFHRSLSDSKSLRVLWTLLLILTVQCLGWFWFFLLSPISSVSFQSPWGLFLAF